MCTIDRQHKYLLCGAIGPYASDQPKGQPMSQRVPWSVANISSPPRVKNARRALACRALRLAPLCRS
jgi:hypothetical protein